MICLPFLLLFFAPAFSDSPVGGLRLDLTEGFLTKVINFLEPTVAHTLKDMEPISLLTKDYNSSVFNLTQVLLTNTSLQSFKFFIDSGHGFRGALMGFSATTNFSADWRFPASSEWSHLNISVALENIDISFSLALAASNGKPVVDFEIVSLQNVSINLQGFNFSNLTIHALEEAIDIFIQNALAPELNPRINAALNQTISDKWKGSVELPVNITGFNITFDYNLSQNPLFVPAYFSLFLEGIVSMNGVNCNRTFPFLPPSNVTRDFQFTINRGLIECVLYDVKQTRLLEQLISDQLDKMGISFDDRILLDIGLATVPDVIFDNDALKTTFNAGLEIGVAKNISGKATQIITVDINATATIDPVISFHYMNSTVVVTLSDVGVTGLNASYFSELIPKKYYDQIKKEDWPGLIGKINTFLQTALGPKPVFPLKISDMVGNLILQFTKNLEFVTGPEYLMVAADINIGF